MNIFRILRLVTLCMVMVGCSTAYKPNENVKTMTSRMTEQDAMATLQKMLVVRDINGNMVNDILGYYWGLCNSNGFLIEGSNGAGVKVTRDGISVTAYKRGELIKTDGTFNYYKKIPYREDLRFTNIRTVHMSEPGLMSQTCARKDGQTEVIVRETFVRWYGVLIPTTEKNLFVAALLRLKPDVEINE